MRSTFILATVLLLASCGDGTSADKGTLEIAVIPKGTTHEYWKAVHAGAERAARELDVEIAWKGPIKEDDRAAQISVVENFIASGVDGMVLIPLDRAALAPVAREASAAGIPVVIADSDLDWDGKASYVATDNRRGGELAAETLAELLGGEGQVMMLRYVEGSASTSAREEGFLATLAEHPGIEVVSSDQYSGAVSQPAFRAAENLLDRFPEVDGIFCPTEGPAFAMLRALEDSGRAGTVRYVAFDASEKLVEGLRAGKIDALVVQDPVRMGELAVRACVEAVRGESPAPRIDTGVQVIRSAEIDEPAAQALLHPDLSILGGD